MEFGNVFHMHMFNMADSAEVDEVESWEDLTDEILERNLAKMKALATPEKETVDEKPGTVVFDANDIRSRYLSQQSEPTVKILKRPSVASGNNQQPQAAGDGPMACVNGDLRGKPRKSLQQRELEYAEARLRIMGQAQSPEEPELTFAERVRQIQIKSSSPSIGTSSSSMNTATTTTDHHPSAATTNHISTSTLSPQSPVFVSHNHHNFATATTTILTAPHFADSAVYTSTAPSPYYAVLAPIAVGGTVLPPASVGNTVLAHKFGPPNHRMITATFDHRMAASGAQIIRQPRGPDGTRGFQFHQPR